MKHLFIKIFSALLVRHENIYARFNSWYWKQKLTIKGAEVGSGFFVQRGARFSFSPLAQFKVKIGPGFTLGTGAMIFIGDNGKLEIEDQVYIGRQTTLAANDRIFIGAGTQIAHHVTLIDTDHAFESAAKPLLEQGQVCKEIIIEKEVWIGAHSVILKGVHIGTHAVIGAGSIVTKPVPAFKTVVGNPARILNKTSNS